GLAAAPYDAKMVAYTNQAVVNITTDGLTPNPGGLGQPLPNNHPRLGPTWQQCYTLLTQQSPERWRTTGLDTTTAWHYAIVPVQNNPSGKPRHFICFTDIGMAASDDEGDSWYFVFMQRGSTALWGNVYELADDRTPT